MKKIIKYENKLTNHEIIEIIEVGKTYKSNLELIIKYVNLICPYINIDNILDNYLFLEGTLNMSLDTIKYLRLENIIIEEIDFINDMYGSEIINFSIKIEDNDIFVFEIPDYENDT